MDKTPRRLRYKKGLNEIIPEKNAKSKPGAKQGAAKKGGMQDRRTRELALKELKSFREKYKPSTERREADEAAENIFEQVKAKEGSQPERQKGRRTQEEAGKNQSEKSFLEMRKTRRQILLEKKQKAPEQKQAKQVQKESKPEQRHHHERRMKKEEEDDEKKENDFEETPKEEERTIENEFFEDDGKKEKSIKDLLDEEDLSLPDFSKEESESISKGDDLTDLELLDEAQDERCPNCKRVALKTFFCPKCGAGFCEKCAKKIAKLSTGELALTCPSCSNEFKARR